MAVGPTGPGLLPGFSCLSARFHSCRKSGCPRLSAVSVRIVLGQFLYRNWFKSYPVVGLRCLFPSPRDYIRKSSNVQILVQSLDCC